MKTWQKILVAFVGAGLTGACSFMSGQFPMWSVVLGATSIAISGAMSILIGWPPKA